MNSPAPTPRSQPQSFVCAPADGAWIVVAAITGRTADALLTAVDFSELLLRFDVSEARGVAVLRSGKKLDISGVEQVSGRVAISLLADEADVADIDDAELRGARVEWMGVRAKATANRSARPPS